MKKKILLVEDEAILVMATQKALNRYDYETSYVTTGEKAVELVCHQNEPIDLILMDIDLGRGIDGTEAARQILEYKEVPIVFLSSHEEPEIVEKTEKITSYGYVVKSSSITVLDASIKMAFKLYDTKMNLTIHQKTLEQNEKDLKASQHIARLGSWRLDVATNDVTWTEELYKMYGFDPSLPPPPYTEHMKLFSSESWERLSAALEETVKTGKPYTLELEMSKESKSIGWMWVKGEAVLDGAGKIVEIWGAAQDITEKRRSEDALRLSEELLDETGKMVRTGGWEVDVAAETVYWTKATKMIYEVPENFEPTIDGAMSYFPGESGERLREAYRRAVEEGEDYDLELDFITAKGNALKVRDIGRAVFNDGKCHKVYGVFQDITEIKNFEQKLKESEEEFRSIFESSALGIFRSTPEGKYELVNKAFARILGFNSPEEVLNEVTDISKLYKYPEDREQIKREFAEKGFVADYEVIANHPENGIVYISINASQRQYPGGSFYYEGTIQDITERKQAEEALKASHDLLNATQRIAGVGGWEWDIADDTWFFSEEWKRIHGVSDDRIDTSKLLEVAHPEDVPQIEKAFSEAKEEGKPYNIRHRIIRADNNEIRYIHALGEVEYSQDTGSPIRMAGTAQDITERHQAEEKLREALKEKDLLMNELNHRVKNSLHMVSSLISLKDSETETDLSDIQHQTKAISLIHEKLYQTESVMEINCRDYFNDLLSSIFLSFSKRPVKIESNIDEIYIPTKSALSLGLLINEIATNSIKHGFTDNEEAVFSIKLEKDIKNARYKLTLSNTGNPFPEDVDIESTSTLGMRLINALVAQLDSTVELQRKPNPKFTIKIPMED